jgi:hypothetical protein
MRLFYAFLLHWSQFDLAVAQHTGRNPDSIAALRADVARWERALEDAEIRTRFG